MPDLNKMPVPKYSADQPYHWEYDNLPLQALEDRDVAINNAVDQQTQILVDAAGTQGNIANRLDQSIDDDGNLKSSAIEEAMHNVAKHSDGTTNVDSEELDFYITTLGYSTMVNPVPFVRMLEAERGKLALVAEEATNLKIQVCTETNRMETGMSDKKGCRSPDTPVLTYTELLSVERRRFHSEVELLEL